MRGKLLTRAGISDRQVGRQGDLGAPIRVLHTNFHLGWGGQAARVFVLCRGLKEKGVDVTVAAPRGSVLVRKCAEAGIRTLDNVRFSKGFRPVDFLHDVRSLRRFILTNQPDILHTHGSQDTWSGAVAAFCVSNAVRPAVVRTRHNTFPVAYSLLNRFLYRWFIDHLIIVSDSVRERYGRFLENGVILPEQVSTVHSCIEVERFEPDKVGKAKARETLGLSSEGPVVAVAARLAREKGHRFLLEAMASVKEKFADIVLLVAGEGNQEGVLRSQVKELGLSGNVRFLGFCDDVVPVFAAADVAVLPSIDCDASSASIKEAMAMRVPVVATNIGGAAEIIEDGVTGLIVPPQDAQALADAITRLLRDETGRARMGRAARAAVIGRFTPRNLVNETLAIYQEMMERGRD